MAAPPMTITSSTPVRRASSNPTARAVATSVAAITPSARHAIFRLTTIFVRRGKVVAIPTDALYTLVADPFNLKAVQQVFNAKGREINRSLPILVSDAMMAEELAKQVPESFQVLPPHLRVFSDAQR